MKALFNVKESSSDARDAGLKAPVEDWDGEPLDEDDEIAVCALAYKHVGKLLLHANCSSSVP